jgi:hypothetical protein
MFLMFMLNIHLRIKFHILSLNEISVIVIKLKQKNHFAQRCFFAFYKIITATEVAYFSKVDYHI